MFIGHYGIALAAKRVVPETSLGTLVLSAQFLDLLWPLFLLLGVEHVRIDPGNTVATPLDFYDYPITHSLVGAVGWAVVLGLLYRFRSGSCRVARTIAALVVSRWVLDAIVHRPDLPLLPGSEIRIGLGLWNSLAATLVIEFVLLLGGGAIYLRTTRASSRSGAIMPWLFIGVLAAIELANLFGPPPPSVNAIAFSCLGLCLFVWWAHRFDFRRRSIFAGIS
jgi:hypothetical protein